MELNDIRAYLGGNPNMVAFGGSYEVGFFHRVLLECPGTGQITVRSKLLTSGIWGPDIDTLVQSGYGAAPSAFSGDGQSFAIALDTGVAVYNWNGSFFMSTGWIGNVYGQFTGVSLSGGLCPT